MRFGAHVSGGGAGLPGIIKKAETLGVDCLQMFATPPSNWNKAKRTDEEMAAFKQQLADSQIGPNVFHAIYLLNLGSDNPELLAKSIDSLTHYLTIGAKMGITGTIFHTGSHKGAGFDAVKKQVCQAFDQILSETPEESCLIIENNAGQGNLIGRDAEEIAQLIDGCRYQDRIKVCLDTCHAFATGVDWRVEGVAEAFIAEYDRLIGWDRIIAFHVNDSKFEVGMNKDRHENLGEGLIGETGFRNLLKQPQMKDKPLFLETPGFANEGPDAENLSRLRKYAEA